MAYAREADAGKVKPLEGAIIRRFIAGSAIEGGEAVAMASDGYVDPAIATAVTLAFAAGIAIQDVSTGEQVDVVVFGPVLCATGATPGAKVYVSDTAGEPAEAAGTKVSLVGWAMKADTVFVNPMLITQS
jgi:hypothetical protein